MSMNETAGPRPLIPALAKFMRRWRPMVSRLSASSSDYSSRAMVIRNCSRVELPVSRLASCRSWDCSLRLAGRTLSASRSSSAASCSHWAF